jgi:hypothetical protein
MSRAARFRALVCATVIVGFAAGLVPAQIESPQYGRSKLPTPERTDAGDWDGTWFYVSRTRKMALWIRSEGGKPRIKLRLEDRAAPAEGFTTDWDSQADYRTGGLHGTFSIEFDERDANTISGTWTWEVDSRKAHTRETADFTLYRLGWGRQLAWQFTDLEREFLGGSRANAKQTLPRLIWTFRKASRREALWGELPF